MIFVTGGARSGKSGFAESLAIKHGGPVTYIATARAGDDEMRARIAGHRRRRPDGWRTVEACSGLPQALEDALAGQGVVLIDCLTVYISNLLMTQGLGAAGRVQKLVDREMENLIGVCRSASGTDTVEECETGRGEAGAGKPGAAGNGRVILVSNEVGMGIVPGNALARAFRDIAGRANQKVAAAADEVYLLVSGIPVKVK